MKTFKDMFDEVLSLSQRKAVGRRMLRLALHHYVDDYYGADRQACVGVALDAFARLVRACLGAGQTKDTVAVVAEMGWMGAQGARSPYLRLSFRGWPRSWPMPPGSLPAGIGQPLAAR